MSGFGTSLRTAASALNPVAAIAICLLVRPRLGAPPLSREHSKRYPFRGDAFLMFKTMPDRVKAPSVGRGVAVSAGASLPPAPDAGFRSSHVGSIYAGAENRRRCYPKQAIIGFGGRDHLLRPSVGKGDSATISTPGLAPKDKASATRRPAPWL
jgi:hypothetical protein